MTSAEHERGYDCKRTDGGNRTKHDPLALSHLRLPLKIRLCAFRSLLTFSPWVLSPAAAILVVSARCHPLKQLLVLTLGRPRRRSAVHSRRSQSYEPLLLENEREAVADLLQFLESTLPSPAHSLVFRSLTLRFYVMFPPSDRQTTNFFTGNPLSALTTLSFSDNVDLQRSAALAFAEITEKEVRPVGRDTLDPILFLLSSHDTEVQRAASAALGNLAVNSACF